MIMDEPKSQLDRATLPEPQNLDLPETLEYQVPVRDLGLTPGIDLKAVDLDRDGCMEMDDRDVRSTS